MVSSANATRTLVIHCGAMKTGTTHIQKTLADGRAALSAAGVCYPRSGALGWAHHNVAFAAARHRAMVASVGDSSATLREAESVDARRVILSSENLWDLSLRQGALERVAQPYVRAGWKPVFIVYLRDQAEWINSMYAQRAKLVAPTPGIAKFARDATAASTSAARFLDKLTRFQKTAEGLGGSLIVRAFAPRIDILRDFIEQVAPEVDVGSLAPQKDRVNRTIGPRTVAASGLLAASPRVRAALEAAQMRGAVRAQALEAGMRVAERRGWNGSAYWGIGKALSKQIADACRTENLLIAKRYWGRSWRDAMGAPSPRAVNAFDRAKAGEDARAEFDAGLREMADAMAEVLSKG